MRSRKGRVSTDALQVAALVVSVLSVAFSVVAVIVSAVAR